MQKSFDKPFDWHQCLDLKWCLATNRWWQCCLNITLSRHWRTSWRLFQCRIVQGPLRRNLWKWSCHRILPWPWRGPNEAVGYCDETEKEKKGSLTLKKKGYVILSYSLASFFSFYLSFLDAFSHLYKRVCPSVRRSVGPSVGRSHTSWISEKWAEFEQNSIGNKKVCHLKDYSKTSTRAVRQRTHLLSELCSTCYP